MVQVDPNTLITKESTLIGLNLINKNENSEKIKFSSKKIYSYDKSNNQVMVDETSQVSSSTESTKNINMSIIVPSVLVSLLVILLIMLIVTKLKNRSLKKRLDINDQVREIHSISRCIMPESICFPNETVNEENEMQVHKIASLRKPFLSLKSKNLFKLLKS